MKHFLTLLVLLTLIPITAAQDEPEPPELLCSPEDVEQALSAWDIFTGNFESARAAADVPTMYQTFIEVAFMADMLRSTCNPLTWEGTGDLVLDPIYIPPGAYRLVITGETGDSAEGEELDEQCNGFFIFVDSDQTKSEEIYRTDGCLMLIALDAGGPWTLTFEKVA